jgi:hypothetical protein
LVRFGHCAAWEICERTYALTRRIWEFSIVTRSDESLEPEDPLGLSDGPSAAQLFGTGCDTLRCTGVCTVGQRQFSGTSPLSFSHNEPVSSRAIDDST